jgi:polyphosphate glucokinase
MPALTLAIDVGGTGLKAAVLDEQGEMITERARVDTPKPSPPAAVVDTLCTLVSPLGAFDRVSVGFPGVVRRGTILTAPNLGTEDWKGFDLRSALSERVGKPVRVKNDAALQGLGAIRGDGVECVITLGTGFGFSLFDDGFISPQLEMAHHPFRKDESYEEQLGKKALKDIGVERWNKRLRRAIETLRNLTNFDRLFIGGGNAKHVAKDLPCDVEIVSNDLGMRGGIWLWKNKHESYENFNARESE